MRTPFLGVLVLDTAFPRIPGDVGHPESYRMPVRFRVVDGADVPLIVRGTPPDPGLIDAFVQAGRALVADGACALVTSCGFLAHAQRRLAAETGVPTLASALSLGPTILAATGGRRIGVLTADSRAMTPLLLREAGLDPATVAIAGMEESTLWQSMILATKSEQRQTFDPSEISRHAAARASALIESDPTIGALLLECGNLPPYANAIRAAAARPVFDIRDAARLLWQAATE